MNQLSWPDIFIDASLLDTRGLLALWPKNLAGNYLPMGFTAFGDGIVQHGSGQVQRLDVIMGGMHPIAQDFAEFERLMNSDEWREDHLLSDMVALQRNRGLFRRPGQFYAFDPHPAAAGKVDWDTVVCLDALDWHCTCSRLLDGVGLPQA